MTRIFKRAAAHTLTLFSSLAVLGMALPAQAQTSDKRGPYATIGITQLSADLDLSNLSAQGNTIDLGEETVKVNMITGRVGYRIMDFLAIEGEAGFGLGGDSFERTIPVAVSGVGTINVDTDVSMDVSNYGGVFARGILPLGDQFEIFARAGYGFAKAEADVVGTVALLPGFSATASESDSVNDFAYGIGAQFNIDDTHGVRLDYSSIGSEVSVVSLSYAINF
jgi:opacity protein-like surface antigen